MSPSPEKIAPPATREGTKEATQAAASPEYSQPERALLLRLVHQSIEAALRGERSAAEPVPSPHLAEQRGAFVTLHLAGRLRGCVGFIQPARGLYQTIVEAALNAAFHDPRFLPVSPEEAPLLQVEISVLSPPRPIRPEEIVVGRHGLVVSRGSYRGLLLPQVALEQEWDALTFLEQSCLKAGLPADAWKHGASLQGFTAEVFGEGGM